MLLHSLAIKIAPRLSPHPPIPVSHTSYFSWCPKALNSICVSHIIDVFSNSMIDSVMVHIGHSLIAQCFICVDCGSWFHMIPDKPFQGRCISAFDYPGANLASFTVFDASHNSLTYWPTSSLLLAFVMAHIFTFAANEGFISFNRSIEPRQPCKIERFPNPMSKELC